MIYISNDCLPDWYYYYNKKQKDFPFTLGYIKVKEYKKLIENIDNINFENITFYNKFDEGYLWYVKSQNFTVGNIDNCFEYYFAHDLEFGHCIEDTKETYFRRLARWNNIKEFTFCFCPVKRQSDICTEEDYIDLINTPTRHKKKLILPDDKGNSFDINETLINNDVEIYHTISSMPYEYYYEIEKDNFFK